MKQAEAFIAAVGEGDAPAVAAMLAKAPSLAAPGSGAAVDPVALAARCGHLAVLRLLLDHGALDAPEADPRQAPSALMQAAGAGQQDAVALLLERGANPALRDPQGRTAADHATEAGHADLAQRLATDSEAERILL